MWLRYNYRVYPTPGQQASLARAFGCARVVFNDGLRARQEARAEGVAYLSDAELSQRVTAAKLTPERAWLGEVSSVVLQQALADLNVAYRNFFSSITGKHKLSTAIIRDNQAVYVEDLCVVGLGRTRLAKSVHDAGWASFTGMLEYKSARYGRTFARVDRFFPSTRMCSDCGRINDKMALNVRAWDCPCGSHHDRDINAANNVKAAGQADFNDRGAQVRPAAMPAPRSEAVTHPDAACFTRSVEGISVL